VDLDDTDRLDDLIAFADLVDISDVVEFVLREVIEPPDAVTDIHNTPSLGRQQSLRMRRNTMASVNDTLQHSHSIDALS
jgi:hypothetical protein